MSRAIVLNEADNVATMLDPVKAGEQCFLQGKRDGRIVVGGDLPFGHKIALSDISAGASVIKYGQNIGRATQHIKVGDHVHVHNVESLRGRGDLTPKEK